MQVIRDNYGASRFDAYVDGEVAASLKYKIQDGEMWLLEIEEDRWHRGLGLGEPLVRRALAEAHRRRLRVLPFCQEARQQVFAHPVFLQLVPREQRSRFHKSWALEGKARAARRRRRVPASAIRTSAAAPAAAR
ncbi:GNAT family N-acetyltransferase [Arthrobacter sulfonylureivorans]|uniref:GNAT family N-acetyltransferase n=1 Tax=Arthrobacter sulfonylureivorans TaxID=2486855 RepID=UPI0039E55D08